MPGDFFGDIFGGGSSRGSMTGTGSPSQSRRNLAPGDTAFGGGNTGMSQGRGGPGGNSYSPLPGGGGQSARQQYPMLYGVNSAGQQGQPRQPNYSTAGGLGGVQSMVDSIYGPQQQILADQLARQQQQLGMVGIESKYQTGVLNRDNALAMQGLGLDRQALGLQRGVAQGELGNLDKLRAILGQQRGLVGERKGLDTETAKDQAARKQWDLRSDLTQRGAFNTVANERGTGRINADLDYSLRGIDQGYRNSLLGLDQQGISYDNQQAGLTAKLAGIGLDAQRLSISGQQLQNSLADGLHAIGLGGQTTINSLLDAMGGTNSQQAALAGQILGEVAGYANLPPDVLAQLQKALGVGPGQGQQSGQGARLPGSRVPL